MENNPTESIRTNLIGTKIMADLAVVYNIQKFILIKYKNDYLGSFINSYYFTKRENIYRIPF